MSKFKVGDRVIRTKGAFSFVREGDVCLVTGLRPNGELYIDDDIYHSYSPSNFDLYVEKDMKGVLTPLQVAEALINGDDLEYTYNGTIWMSAEQEDGEVFFYNDGVYKYRVKPKIIVINGVEVPASLYKKPNQEFIYFINLFKGRVYQLPTEKLTFNHKYYWATKEDAQKVLDAMLIPFNES